MLLSGTPVQNDLGELLSLMSFLMPHVFGRENDVDELLEAFGWDKKSGASNGKGGASINQLRSMLAPFVLRRVKSDVLDQLVDKECFLEKAPMTAFQQTVYDNILCAHANRKEQYKEMEARKAEEVASLVAGLASNGRGADDEKKKRKGGALSKELMDLTGSSSSSSSSSAMVSVKSKGGARVGEDEGLGQGDLKVDLQISTPFPSSINMNLSDVFPLCAGGSESV